MNGLTKWILGVLFFLVTAAGGFIFHHVVIGGIQANDAALEAHRKVGAHGDAERQLRDLSRNMAEVRRRQLVLINQLILIHGAPAEGPVPPDVMRELIGEVP